jgi:flavin-dependent dehydrogenase
MTIREPAKDLPVTHEADIVVVGGSCTGVFAALRAARLGMRVAIIEKQNCFAGVACALAARNDCAVSEVDVRCLRQTLAEGGSIVL